MKTTVTLSGGKGYSEHIRRLRDRLAKNPGVLVGVPKGKGNYEDGTKIAVIAAVNEYGSADGIIPERSFLRVPLRAEKKKFATTFRKSIPDVVHGTLEMRQMMDRVGLQAAGVVQQAIAAGIEPANAPSTVAQKGSSKPLIDTGALRQSITHVIEGDEEA